MPSMTVVTKQGKVSIRNAVRIEMDSQFVRVMTSDASWAAEIARPEFLGYYNDPDVIEETTGDFSDKYRASLDDIEDDAYKLQHHEWSHGSYKLAEQLFPEILNHIRFLYQEIARLKEGISNASD